MGVHVCKGGGGGVMLQRSTGEAQASQANQPENSTAATAAGGIWGDVQWVCMMNPRLRRGSHGDAAAVMCPWKCAEPS